MPHGESSQIHLGQHDFILLICNLSCQAVIPRYLLKPIPGERDLGVELKMETLKSIRGPSKDGTFFLRKECIRRAYQLVENPSAAPAPLDDTTLLVDRAPPWKRLQMESLDDPARYCEVVQAIRRTLKPGYVLLYHYTDPRFIESILKGGLRMSTQGQGDGGVYKSTRGLGSYKFGSKQYEELLIVDCFGPERIDEYVGKGKLDVLLILVVHESLLSFVPGDRDNAVFIQKRAFETLVSPAKDGCHYLHPSVIAACFRVNPGAIAAEPEREILNQEAQGDEDQVQALYKRMREAATWSAPTLVPETVQDRIEDATSRLTGRRGSVLSQGTAQERRSTRRSQLSSFMPRFSAQPPSTNSGEAPRRSQRSSLVPRFIAKRLSSDGPDRSQSFDIELSAVHGVDVTSWEESTAISAVNPMLDQAIPFPAKRQGGSTVEVELGEGIEVKEGDSNADLGEFHSPQNTTAGVSAPANLV